MGRTRLLTGLVAACLAAAPAAAQTPWTRDHVEKALGIDFMTPKKKDGKPLAYEPLTLPDGLDGWLFMTWRKPTLLLDNRGKRSRLWLGVYWNGLDDRDWPHWRLLARLMKTLCSFGGGDVDHAPVKELLDKEGEPLHPQRYIGGNAGIWRSARWTGTAGRCDVQVQRTGSRWHTVYVTLKPRGKQ